MKLRAVLPFLLLPLLLVSSSLSVADSEAASPQVIMMMYHRAYPKYVPEHITPEFLKEKHELEQVYKKWAVIFHMEDWNTEVTPVPLSFLKEFCPSECFAGSNWNIYDESGVMFILQRSEYTNEMKKSLRQRHVSIWSDQRNSVLHEILHNVIEHGYEEAVVSTLANLLNP
jgi:hypothetical protein